MGRSLGANVGGGSEQLKILMKVLPKGKNKGWIIKVVEIKMNLIWEGESRK